jgi:hypothetical protein
MEAQRARKSVSTFAPCATNFAFNHLLGESASSAGQLQSSPVGACLEGTMSASGDLPSIGALTVEEKCPDRSAETLVKRLQELGT